MQRSSRSRHEPPRVSAFTLIEVLVSLVILSAGIVMVLRAFETSLVALAESRDSLRATMIIKERMAEYEIAALAGANAFQAAPMEGESCDWTAPGRMFEWRAQVTAESAADNSAAAGGGSNSLNAVVVTVRRSGSDRSQSAAGYVRVK
jgi:type II secretion system protein I